MALSKWTRAARSRRWRKSWRIFPPSCGDPSIDNVIGVRRAAAGGNTARMFAVLKPPEDRDAPLGQILGRLRKQLANEPGGQPVPATDARPPRRRPFGRALSEYTLQAERLADLREWTPKTSKALSARPELADVNTDSQDKGQQVSLTVDRDTAARLGVSRALIDATLNDAFGQRQVSVIYNPLNQYHVVMELAPEYWQSPQALEQIYLSVAPKPPQTATTQAPLSAVASFAPTNTPLAVNHQGQFAAATISFNLKPGAALSDATLAIDQTLQALGVPASVHGGFQGTAKVFQESLKNQPWLILAALAAIYIVLGVLYESYVHPLTILSTLPSAGVGAILALLATGTEFSIIALIGVILLIGIVKKNAIMMVDFALQAERGQGLGAGEAIFTACLTRFRPIMMTTCAALLGALPLALGTGYGAELRRPLGISIVGGLLVSQLLTLYTTPVVYLYLERFRLWCGGVPRLPGSRPDGTGQ